MKRLVTGLGLIAFAVYLIFWAPHVVFIGAAVLMSLLCYWEYSGLVTSHAIKAPGMAGLAAGLVIIFRPDWTLLGTVLVLIIALAAALRFSNLRDILPYIACAILGAFYTFAPWRFAIDLRRESVHLLFFALALNWAGDTVAYYIGRRFGRHKLAPIVSPNKSWEGAIASLIGSLIFGLIYLGYLLPELALWKVAGIAMAGNIAGQLGDLAESAVKRGAGVKDSGNLLPGHGGLLDRVDSSLFALPVAYGLYLAAKLT